MKHKAVIVAVLSLDGTVIESFPVFHWKTNETGLSLIDAELVAAGREDATDDGESVGSHASEALLMDRIRKHVRSI